MQNKCDDKNRITIRLESLITRNNKTNSANTKKDFFTFTDPYKPQNKAKAKAKRDTL